MCEKWGIHVLYMDVEARVQPWVSSLLPTLLSQGGGGSTHMPWLECDGNNFSPSTTWGSGISLRPSGLAARALIRGGILPSPPPSFGVRFFH